MQSRFQHSANNTPRLRRHCLYARVRAANESGHAVAEFALVLLPLSLLVFGILQFSLACNTAMDQTHIANEVARYAIVNENPGAKEATPITLAQWAKNQEDTGSSALESKGKVCISFPSGTEIGAPVKVEVTSTTNWLPILHLEPTKLVTTRTAYMRLEAPPSTYGAECSS